jgi:acyl-CoA synthetase (AMP-forming)/AMP-acid ligase II
MLTKMEFTDQLRERLLGHRDKILLRVVVSPDFENPREFSGRELIEKAESLTSTLALPQDRSVVLLLLPHSPEVFLLQLGLVLQGHIPAILAWPTTRVDSEKYQQNLIHQLSHLPAGQLITLPRLAENLAGSLPYPITGIPLENAAVFERLFPAAPLTQNLKSRELPAHRSLPSSESLFLQFSGGTTGAQKAIVVTAPMLLRQLNNLAEALQITSMDGVVSWLPLYHDMGLIACFWLPLWHGAASLQLAASDWLLNPALLFKFISRYRATICWLPNFSFSYISQRCGHLQNTYELDSVRTWINCSEPVRLKSLTEFADAFAGNGVRRNQLQASYAMAETVFAITQTELNKELTTIPRNLVHRGKHPCANLAFDLIDDVYVSSGKPLADTELRIVSADGTPCPEAVPGEIHVRTPSLFSGYWGSDGFKTHSLRDGLHATGDFGFLADGELFVIGRFKDIVIVGGNNIFPEDVESIVGSVEGIYPGRVATFGVEDKDYGTQGLAVVAEMKSKFDEEKASDLEAVIRKLVLTTIGTAPRYVAVVPGRWIVKSTAGKISRRETRERFIRERLNHI